MQRRFDMSILSEFLEQLADAHELVDVNIAAGIAAQELDGVEEPA